jgi:hypothetical protein
MSVLYAPTPERVVDTRQTAWCGGSWRTLEPWPCDDRRGIADGARACLRAEHKTRYPILEPISTEVRTQIPQIKSALLAEKRPGGGRRNRTLVSSFGEKHSATELCPHVYCRFWRPPRLNDISRSGVPQSPAYRQAGATERCPLFDQIGCEPILSNSSELVEGRYFPLIFPSLCFVFFRHQLQ